MIINGNVQLYLMEGLQFLHRFALQVLQVPQLIFSALATYHLSNFAVVLRLDAALDTENTTYNLRNF